MVSVDRMRRTTYSPAVFTAAKIRLTVDRALANRTTRAMVLALICGSGGWGCHSDSGFTCQGGQICACGNGPDCFLQCNGDLCNLDCSHTANACGSVCNNACLASCHDTNNCSAACGDACTLTCDHTASCGAQCGAHCAYSCSNTTRCGVDVGPGSTVMCDTLATCVVNCAGSCSVTCHSVDSCTVNCAPGHTQSDSGNGTITCS